MTSAPQPAPCWSRCVRRWGGGGDFLLLLGTPIDALPPTRAQGPAKHGGRAYYINSPAFSHADLAGLLCCPGPARGLRAGSTMGGGGRWTSCRRALRMMGRSRGSVTQSQHPRTRAPPLLQVPEEGVKAALAGFGMLDWQQEGILQLNRRMAAGAQRSAAGAPAPVCAGTHAARTPPCRHLRVPVGLRGAHGPPRHDCGGLRAGHRQVRRVFRGAVAMIAVKPSFWGCGLDFRLVQCQDCNAPMVYPAPSCALIHPA